MPPYTVEGIEKDPPGEEKEEPPENSYSPEERER